MIKFALCRFVEGTADFVKQKDVATVEQSAGDSDTLGLSLAESAASFSKFGVYAFWQIKDEIGTGGMQHFAQFIVGGMWIRVKIGSN